MKVLAEFTYVEWGPSSSKRLGKYPKSFHILQYTVKKLRIQSIGEKGTGKIDVGTCVINTEADG